VNFVNVNLKKSSDKIRLTRYQTKLGSADWLTLPGDIKEFVLYDYKRRFLDKSIIPRE
jgi:hypothetical protein